MADQQGTWVNLTGELAEFVPVGEKCSANVKAEQDMYAQELAVAGGRAEPDDVDREAARIMTASESDLDAIIREQGGTPMDYAARGKRAVELAKETIRARNAGVAAAPEAGPLDVEDLAYSAAEEGAAVGYSVDLFRRYFKTVAQRVAARGVADTPASGWRPLSEPPSKPGRYIVAHRGGTGGDAFFNAPGKPGWSQLEDYNFTHWCVPPAGVMGTLNYQQENTK